MSRENLSDPINNTNNKQPILHNQINNLKIKSIPSKPPNQPPTPPTYQPQSSHQSKPQPQTPSHKKSSPEQHSNSNWNSNSPPPTKTKSKKKMQKYSKMKTKTAKPPPQSYTTASGSRYIYQPIWALREQTWGQTWEWTSAPQMQDQIELHIRPWYSDLGLPTEARRGIEGDLGC